MKSKLCWIPFIPLTIAAVALNVLNSLGVFKDLPSNTLPFLSVAAVVLMLIINIVLVILDKDTSPAYLLTRNIPAAVVAFVAAGATASKSALTIILALQNKTLDFMSIVLTVFGMLAAVCLVVIAIAHFQGRNFLPRMGALFLTMPVWAGLALIQEFLDNRTVSVALVDPVKLVCLAVLMIYLFKLSMVIATVDGKNPVKAMFLYGFPLAGLGLAYGAGNLTNAALNGLDYSENVMGVMLIAISLYVIFFNIEITRLGRTNEEQIVRFDLDDYNEEQLVYGAYQDSTIAQSDVKSDEYDYSYYYGSSEDISDYLTETDETYSEEDDYAYGYGIKADEEDLVVAPDAEDDDAIYVDSSVVGSFEEKLIETNEEAALEESNTTGSAKNAGGKTEQPVSAEDYDNTDEKLAKIDKLLADLDKN